MSFRAKTVFLRIVCALAVCMGVVHCSHADSDVWKVGTQEDWVANTEELSRIEIVEGMAKPTEKTATFRSVLKRFDEKQSAKSIVIEQSPVWDNWEPAVDIGPGCTFDSPVLLSLGPKNYWFFARHNKGSENKAWDSSKGQFKAKEVKLDGFDMPLLTTPIPNQFRANGLVVRLDPPPRLYHNVAGRKFAWQGDYWRAITPIGIWKGVRLEATEKVRITDVHPISRIGNNGSANIEFEISLANHDPKKVKTNRVRAVVRGKNFQDGPYESDTTISISETEGRASLTVNIPQAKLWWPWDMGKPNLYVVETTVSDENGKMLDRMETTFGVREVRMERNPGYSKEEVHYPWTMVINGKRTFLRSANWGGPPDIFYGRNNFEKYRKLVNLARDANINNLRIFGWHPPEVDDFYELCDESGITVWQDLIPLASVSLPQDEEFRKATYAEAVSVIKTLRNHPSLVLLEGGEEMFYGSQGLEYNAEFLVGLEKAIRPYTDLPYIPTSPLNWPRILHELGIGRKKDSGHTHELFYAMGRRLMEDYVSTWDYAVIPEFAVSSAPCPDSIAKFIPLEEIWPPGPSWGYHWADLDVFRALNFQVFGDERTDNLESFVDATQIAQGTIFQWGIEHMRRRKPKSSAISICHFMTFSPDMKWGIVDYYQVPKRSYDFVKRAYQPLLVSLDIPKRRWLPGETFKSAIWLVNDLHKMFEDCRLNLAIANQRGKRVFEQTKEVKSIAGDSSVHFADFEWIVGGTQGENFQVEAMLVDKTERTISANHYVLLIAEQEQARRECRELAERLQATKTPFPTGDYYRFFPERFEQDLEE